MKKFRSGFTLIEVVVALTVLSMISLATLSAIRTFGSTQQKLDIVSERTQEMRAVSQFLRRVLVDAQPLMRQSPGAYSSFFQGDQSELLWVAPFSASRLIGGLTVFRLVANDAQQLTVQFTPFHDANQELDWSTHEPYVLVDQLNEFTLTYSASPTDDWVVAWGNEAQNPDRVRLSIAANGRYWPDLIIRFNESNDQSLPGF